MNIKLPEEKGYKHLVFARYLNRGDTCYEIGSLRKMVMVKGKNDYPWFKWTERTKEDIEWGFGYGWSFDAVITNKPIKISTWKYNGSRTQRQPEDLIVSIELFEGDDILEKAKKLKNKYRA